MRAKKRERERATEKKRGKSGGGADARPFFPQKIKQSRRMRFIVVVVRRLVVVRGCRAEQSGEAKAETTAETERVAAEAAKKRNEGRRTAQRMQIIRTIIHRENISIR